MKMTIATSGYDLRQWGASWFAWTIVDKFSQLDWRTNAACAVPDPATFNTDNELNQLLKLARLERGDALGEINAQNGEFLSYFMALMGIDGHSHPATCRVMAAASLIGTLVCVHWKEHWKRPRPSQLCPPLLPPVQVPGHPAYPSGHATQSRLVARCMVRIFEDKPRPAKDIAAAEKALYALAARIAHNREIAGLHYESDSVQGAALANNIFLQYLANGAPKLVASFDDAITAALGEW